MIAIYKNDFLAPEILYPLMGRNIKRLRQQNKMTQEQLAEKINMDQKQISNIESGRARARLSTYLRIANVFDVSIDHFLAEALLVDLNDLPNSALSRKSEQRFLRDVILAVLNYLKRKET